MGSATRTASEIVLKPNRRASSPRTTIANVSSNPSPRPTFTPYRDAYNSLTRRNTVASSRCPTGGSGCFKIANVNDNVYEIIEIIGANTLLDIYDNVDEAIGSLQTSKDKTICVTLGKRGVLALIDGEPLIVPGRSVEAVDTTGAGDCFVGAVAAQLAGRKSIRDAPFRADSYNPHAISRAARPSCPPQAGAAPVRMH